jgi:hypothetical protein
MIPKCILFEVVILSAAKNHRISSLRLPVLFIEPETTVRSSLR